VSSTPLIWHAGARKEASELIEQLWRTAGDAVRDRLAEVLLAGPPEDLDGDLAEPEQRQARRDRRLFDRLGLVTRLRLCRLGYSRLKMRSFSGIPNGSSGRASKHVTWFGPR